MGPINAASDTAAPFANSLSIRVGSDGSLVDVHGGADRVGIKMSDVDAKSMDDRLRMRATFRYLVRSRSDADLKVGLCMNGAVTLPILRQGPRYKISDLPSCSARYSNRPVITMSGYTQATGNAAIAAGTTTLFHRKLFLAKTGFARAVSRRCPVLNPFRLHHFSTAVGEETGYTDDPALATGAGGQ